MYCDGCGAHITDTNKAIIARNGGELIAVACDECKDAWNWAAELVQCADCGNYYVRDAHEPDRDGRGPHDDSNGSWIPQQNCWVCKNCLRTGYYRCSVCGDWIHTDSPEFCWFDFDDGKGERIMHVACRDYILEFGSDDDD